MNENVPAVNDEKKNKQGPQYHTWKAWIEKNLSHLHGVAAQPSMLEVDGITIASVLTSSYPIKFYENTVAQYSETLGITRKRGSAFLAGVQTLQSTILSREDLGAASWDRAESSPICRESPRLFPNEQLGTQHATTRNPAVRLRTVVSPTTLLMGW